MSGDGKSLALVVRNADPNQSQGFTFDLTALPTLGPTCDVYRTSTSEDLVGPSPIAIEEYRLVVETPAYSITTFVLPMP